MAIEMIAKQHYEEMQEADQLLIEMRNNPAFRWNDFQEAPIKLCVYANMCAHIQVQSNE